MILLIRTDKKEDGVIGQFFNSDGDFICDSLERPKLYEGEENLRDDGKTAINESCCIPEGVYEVERTYSPMFEKNLFLIKGVNSRDGVRIHPANAISELLGCIAPCLGFSYNVSFKGKMEAIFGKSSANALRALEAEIGADKFTLKITSYESLCTL
tara:strand:- start:405 stop:872 length:468 start_codon:yes stop_codon:yes gene_type:complete